MIRSYIMLEYPGCRQNATKTIDKEASCQSLVTEIYFNKGKKYLFIFFTIEYEEKYLGLWKKRHLFLYFHIEGNQKQGYLVT